MNHPREDHPVLLIDALGVLRPQLLDLVALLLEQLLEAVTLRLDLLLDAVALLLELPRHVRLHLLEAARVLRAHRLQVPLHRAQALVDLLVGPFELADALFHHHRAIILPQRKRCRTAR